MSFFKTEAEDAAEAARWRTAHALGWSPRTCWYRLCSWAQTGWQGDGECSGDDLEDGYGLDGIHVRQRHMPPVSGREARMCRRDSLDEDSCWCGKFKNGAVSMSEGKRKTI